MSEYVTLLGGPAHLATLEVKDSRTPLLVQGHGVPEGCVARYRPEDARKQNETYRFVSFDKVVASVPAPGPAA